MGILFDLGILLIIFISTIIGYKVGFIKVAFRLLSFILALVIALVLYKPISNLIIDHTSIPHKIETQISSRLSSEDKSSTDNIVSNYYNNVKNYSTNVMAHNISITIVNISSVLLVFIITRFLLFFLKFSTDLIAKLPLIKQFNHIGGFIYGIIAGFFIVYFIFTVITLLAPLIDLSKFLNLINSSIIGNIMYNNKYLHFDILHILMRYYLDL